MIIIILAVSLVEICNASADDLFSKSCDFKESVSYCLEGTGSLSPRVTIGFQSEERWVKVVQKGIEINVIGDATGSVVPVPQNECKFPAVLSKNELFTKKFPDDIERSSLLSHEFLGFSDERFRLSFSDSGGPRDKLKLRADDDCLEKGQANGNPEGYDCVGDLDFSTKNCSFCVRVLNSPRNSTGCPVKDGQGFERDQREVLFLPYMGLNEDRKPCSKVLTSNQSLDPANLVDGICYKREGCYQHSPKQLWDIYEKRRTSSKGSLKGMVLQAIKSQPGGYKRNTDFVKIFASYWNRYGTSYLLYNQKTNCSTIKTTKLNECRWVLEVNIENSGECWGVKHSGYIGQRICHLSCESEFEITFCDNLVCRKRRDMTPPDAAPVYIKGKNTYIKSNVEYAWVPGAAIRKCVGVKGFLVCEGVDEIKVLCNSRLCKSFTSLGELNKEEIEGLTCFGDLCHNSNDGFSSRKLQVHEGKVSVIISQEGKQMVLRAQSRDGWVDQCCIKSNLNSVCKDCEHSINCVINLDMSFAEKGSDVFVECGDTSNSLRWDYNSIFGNTNHKLINEAGNYFYESTMYYKLVLVVIICVILQMLNWLINFKSLFFMMLSFLVWLLKGVFNFYKFGRLFRLNFFWHRVEPCWCKRCKADMNFVDHTKICLADISNGCPYLDRGAMCCENLVDGYAGERHWVLSHLHQYNIGLIMWLNPFNWLHFLSYKKTATTTPIQRKAVKKSNFLLPIVILGLVAPASAVSNVEVAKSCSNGTCVIDSKIKMDSLFVGDQNCVTFKSEGLSEDFCFHLKGLSLSKTAPIIKCRAEIDIKVYQKITCGSGSTGCYYYSGELDEFKKCPTAVDEEVFWGGGLSSWGCFGQGINSLCIKSKASDLGGSNYCLVDTTGDWSVSAVLCMTVSGVTICDDKATGVLEGLGLKFSYYIQGDFASKLPPKLILKESKPVRIALDENNGCFEVSKKKQNGTKCDTGLSFERGNCKYTVVHRYEVKVECLFKGPEYCEEELSFPLMPGSGCYVQAFELNQDKNSYHLTTSGCLKGPATVSGRINGTVTQAINLVQVKSIGVSDCKGYSGLTLSASCKVVIFCSGYGHIKLNKPSNDDMICGEPKRVFFTASSGLIKFSAANFERDFQVELKVALPESWHPEYRNTAVTTGSVDWYKYLMVFLIVLSVVFCVTLVYLFVKKLLEIESRLKDR